MKKSTFARKSTSSFTLTFIITLLLSSVLIISCAHNKEAAAPAKNISEPLLTNIRQLTYDGLRSGEGYFSPDGELMIFQSEREGDNPFYQMFVKNLNTNETHRVSPGYGKTTCGWIAPNKKSLIFSSTHLDPRSKALQKAEFEERKAPKKRYSWDYDENYEIFHADIKGRNLKNLTRTLGYDAEGSISPDGKLIVFASNRNAYNRTLSLEENEKLKIDPAYFMDLFVMNIDGSNVRQLTKSPGYDGGPFFSPDGKRITWRRFTPDGHTAEISTINIDGTDEKQLTKLGAMSWAPFYHPSGDYLIFTTSLHGHHNFELYMVDANGTQKPYRVTNADGFDGLPVFTPDGQKLTWNKKLSASSSQIMIASWNDTLAREVLKLPMQPPSAQMVTAEINERDAKLFLNYLASRELLGRSTGSEGENQAALMIAQYFQDIGLSAFDGKQYLQKFNFLKDAKLGKDNQLVVEHDKSEELTLDKTWRPLAFSKVGKVESSAIVFAGYGIVAPKDNSNLSYDSYEGLDVKDKWVMVFRYIPEEVSNARRMYLQRYAKLEHKTAMARDRGARGIIFVSGPNSKAKDELISFGRTIGSTFDVAVVSLADEMAEQFLSLNQKELKKIQDDLDAEKPLPGFEISNIKLSANIEINEVTGETHNILGLLKVPGAKHTIVVGAHLDHLGDTPNESSLRTSIDKETIHFGADDNASGIAALLEIAHFLKSVTLEKSGNRLKQNILFAAWSGEELGNLGSTHFIRQLKNLGIKPSAYVNMDMVGRWKKSSDGTGLEPLAIQGLGSSPDWKKLLESVQYDFQMHLQDDPYLPTDAMAFYIAQVPIISFFTGVHSDYHTPRDTAEKINFTGITKIATSVASLTKKISENDSPLKYEKVSPTSMGSKRGFRIYLGTIPDYSQPKVQGVLLSGVVTGGPAEKAGLTSGDVIIEFSSHKIQNIHDYVFALESLRPNVAAKIVVLRNGQKREVTIVPTAKE